MSRSQKESPYLHDGRDPLRHKTYLDTIDALTGSISGDWSHVLLTSKDTSSDETHSLYYWPFILNDSTSLPIGFAEVSVDPLSQTKNARIYSVQQTDSGLISYTAERYFDSMVGEHIVRMLMYRFTGDYESAYAEKMKLTDRTGMGLGTHTDIKKARDPLNWFLPPHRLRIEEPIWSSKTHPYSFRSLTESVDWNAPNTSKYADFKFASDITFIPSVNGYFKMDTSGRMTAIVRALDNATSQISYTSFPHTDGESEPSASVMAELQQLFHGSQQRYGERDEISLAQIGDTFLGLFDQIKTGICVGKTGFFDKTHLQ